MKYYLVVGEASGDLHASKLMASIKRHDHSAEFRFYGGDHMSAEGGTRVRHFKDIAYMGFMPVFTHLHTILRARKACKQDILRWQPDAVILVDYADFNLNIARFIKTTHRFATATPHVFFYIAPKLWAWKEGRIRLFRQYVDTLFCILPFEKDFFEVKHHYPVHYIGSPTADEVREFKASYHDTRDTFCQQHQLDSRPIIALLAGSRKQEVKDSLPMMVKIASHFADFQFVVACVPTIENAFYDKFLQGSGIHKVKDATYPLLAHATSALVTSGTATLEAACFNVPQVVLYKTILPHITRLVWNNCFGVRYISLVNLIAQKEVVAEMFAEKFKEETILTEFKKTLPGSPQRDTMLADYARVHILLGDTVPPDNAADIINTLLTQPRA